MGARSFLGTMAFPILSSLFCFSLFSFASLIQEAIPVASEIAHLDPRLLKAVIEVESCGNPKALSPKGARGLMQLMPHTARELNLPNRETVLGHVVAAALLLRHYLNLFKGDLSLALAAYNAGPARVRQYGTIPPFAETRRYVAKVLSRLGK